MGNPKVVVGRLMGDGLLVKSIATSKNMNWLKWLDAEELVEFFAELLKLVTQISQGKKGADALPLFLSEWREDDKRRIGEKRLLKCSYCNQSYWYDSISTEGHP